MASEKRIPRVRIHEDNFSEEIKNPPYPEGLSEFNVNDYFIEVVNSKDEVIALFFLYSPLKKTDFRDVYEFAEYYDSIGKGQMEEEDWQMTMHIAGFKSMEELDDFMNREGFIWDSKEDFSDLGRVAACLIDFGRIKYPLGRKDEDRSLYGASIFENFDWLVEASDLDDAFDCINYAFTEGDDWIEQINWKISENEFYPRLFLNQGIEFLSRVANNLFTKENINQFIDRANLDGQTEILAFLMDYKNKHFPANGDSLLLNPSD